MLNLSPKEVKVRDILASYCDPAVVSRLVVECNERGHRIYSMASLAEDWTKEAVVLFLNEHPEVTTDSPLVQEFIKKNSTPSRKQSVCHIGRLQRRAMPQYYEEVTPAQHKSKTLEEKIEAMYNATQKAVSIFCLVQFGDRQHDFRWSDLSSQDQRIYEVIAEDFVCKFNQFTIPLFLAEDSWAVRAMLSVQIKNNGSNKTGNQVHIYTNNSFSKLLLY